MVGLQPIFKKAYWSLAAGGLLYVGIIYSLTFPKVQRQYVYTTKSRNEINQIRASADCQYSALYANKLNPSAWQDVNDVEPFGFLSMSWHLMSSCYGELSCL